MTPPRLPLASRLAAVLCAIAAFATALALLLQDRSLSEDLRAAAQARLERASSAASHLLQSHLETLAERYRAISGTPELVANLEVNHAPTLAYYAERLAERQGAAVVLFLDREGRSIAAAGDPGLRDAVLERRQRLAEQGERVGPKPAHPLSETDAHSSLLEQGGRPYAVTAVPLRLRGRPVGRLVALEEISQGLVSGWSELCGARVSVGSRADPDVGDFAQPVRGGHGLPVWVSASLQAERDALANARRNLMAAGLAALALAFAASLLVSKGLVRPIRAIQHAAERIGHGELAFRLDLDRGDEVGDVAGAFNLMLERLAATQGRLGNAQRLARMGNWSIDGRTCELEGSAEFRRIFEFEHDEAPLSADQLLARIHPEERERFGQALEDCLLDGKPFRIDHRVLAMDGSERILHSQGERVEEGDGPLLEGTVQDITERKLVEEQIRYLAYHDSLTGLGNRRLFKERLHVAIEQARRQGSLVGVMFLDVDDFKVINDTLGHSAGDVLLQEVADRLVTAAHAADETVRETGRSLSSTVSRLGGDEFTVLLADLESREDVETSARRLLDVFGRPFDLKSQEVAVSGSIGITIWPHDGEDVEVLLRNSDTAMYHAKRRGRNSYHYYAESMQEAVSRRLVLENKLRRAIEADEFLLLYQPKVDIETGLISGVEALLRWRDPQAGVVMPDEFIPLAEETGLIVPLGQWVLRAAARQALAWREAGLPPLRVAVNLSPYQIEDPGFGGFVAGVLQETGLPPEQLELEITESTLMKDEEAAIELLRELQSMGIGLSLDDFGTGYSSLSYLRSLPIDTLKIDRSFVRRVDSDPADAALAASMVSMAKVLRLRVVVEGVETEEQREFLREIGCDEIQGFLFSSAITAEELSAMLRNQKPKRRPGRRRARRTRAAVREKKATGQATGQPRSR